MGDPARIDEVLNEFRELWLLNPDLRFSQLLFNIYGAGADPFYMEDSQLLKLIKEKRELWEENPCVYKTQKKILKILNEKNLKNS